MLLKIGSKGQDVKKLQEMLNFLLGAKLKIDGVFGEKTRQAVIVFQKLEKLQVDGIVGKQTIARLKLRVASKKKKTQELKPLKGTIFIDIGHVGKRKRTADMGATYKGYTEAGIYLKIIEEVRKNIHKITNNTYTIIIYPSDFYEGRELKRMEYSERNEIAKKLKANIYYQLHMNAGRGDYALFLHKEDNMRYNILKMKDKYEKLTRIRTIVKKLSPGDRGYVCFEKAKNAVLLEPLFIDNDKHLQFALSDDFVDVLSQVLVEGAK